MRLFSLRLCLLCRPSPYNADDRAGLKVKMEMFKPVTDEDTDGEPDTNTIAYISNSVQMCVSIYLKLVHSMALALAFHLLDN